MSMYERKGSDTPPTARRNDLGLGGFIPGPMRLAGGAVAIALVLLASYFTVDAGYVAVTKRFGAVREGVYQPGLHFKVPLLDSVVHVETRLASVDAKADAASRDLQVVKAQVSVPYSLEPSLVGALINTIGTRERFERSILANAIQESVKGTTAAYTAEELITKRGEAKTRIAQAIESFVRDTLEKKGLPGLAPIANVAISDFDFSDEFNTSIEQRVQAEVNKAKRITDAEAKNAEVRLAADSEAYRVQKEAESRATAINAEGVALEKNPLLLKLRIAERWDGVLPRFNGGGQLPMLTMDANEIVGQPAAKAASR